LNSTCKLYCPAGRLIDTTVTLGFGWSVCPAGRAGSPDNRSAAPVVKLAPAGAFRICIVNVCPSRVNVANVPLVSTETVALVCMRHMTLARAVISSCNSTCCRAFKSRTPRENDDLIHERQFHNVLYLRPSCSHVGICTRQVKDSVGGRTTGRFEYRARSLYSARRAVNHRRVCRDNLVLFVHQNGILTLCSLSVV
jgi:hypothetical protein